MLQGRLAIRVLYVTMVTSDMRVSLILLCLSWREGRRTCKGAIKSGAIVRIWKVIESIAPVIHVIGSSSTMILV